MSEKKAKTKKTKKTDELEARVKSLEGIMSLVFADIKSLGLRTDYLRGRVDGTEQNPQPEGILTPEKKLVIPN